MAVLPWLVMLVACHGSALAVEYRLSPVADTTIFGDEGGGTVNDALSDGGANLWSGTTFGSHVRRAMLRFDLSGIAPGSRIESAQLSLYEIRARDNGNVALHRVLATWGEATSSAGDAGSGVHAQAGDATWSHRFYPTVPWAVRGGDFAPQASASTFVGSSGERYAWASAQMVADVQSWLDTPASNQGWILVGDESRSGTAKRYGSRENDVVSAQPVLILQVEPPSVSQDGGDVPLPLWATFALGSALLALMGVSRNRV